MTDITPLRFTVHDTTLELVIGDITKEGTDAIVNAANSSLMGGGGVDGAIHRAAGPKLVQETKQLGGCKTGDAKISGGYRLATRHVIHTVGPVYRRGDPTVADLLASAYRRSMEVAAENNLESLAFPAISTGIYGYPMEEAAHIALSTVINFLQAPSSIRKVRFVLFSEEAYTTFSKALRKLEHDLDS